jgi:hypothetical protein
MKTEQDELDDFKGLVHKEFDWLWQSGRMSRRTAYVWMQLKLNLKPSKAHIRLLNRDQLGNLLGEIRKYKEDLTK